MFKLQGNNIAIIGSGIASTSGTSQSGPPPLVGDYYVDPVNGNDSNDGLSRQTAFQTISKLNTVISPLTAQTTVVCVSGTYVGSGFVIASVNDIILQCEENCVFNTSSVGAGITVSSSGKLTAYLRGAEFIGTNTGSANGIGTTNDVVCKIYGEASNGTKAHFHSYDDGVSFHGTTVDISKIVIDNCRFSNNTKSAFAHVNNSSGLHYNCIFEGRSAATLGIGDDSSTQVSEFYDCEFIPATAGQNCNVGYVERCIVGSINLHVTLNFNRPVGSVTAIDCFINANQDAPRDDGFTFNACYGFFSYRVRGASGPVSTMTNCIFARRQYATIQNNNFSDGAFDAGDGNWLGGQMNFINTIIRDFSTAFRFTSTAQRDHMNSTWVVNNCSFFNNTTNFQAGISLGTSLIFTDPLMAGMSTTAKSSWGFLSGSPCIGAGVGGTNIGFPV